MTRYGPTGHPIDPSECVNSFGERCGPIDCVRDHVATECAIADTCSMDRKCSNFRNCIKAPTAADVRALSEILTAHEGPYVAGDASPFEGVTAAQLNELRRELLGERKLDLMEAIKILEEFKADTETTDWVYPQMKRALLSGIVASIRKLNEAAKR